jgi:hypothetical protein
MLQGNFGGNEQVRCDEIWKIAARNNVKSKQVTYRINGERVSKSEFDKFKGSK